MKTRATCSSGEGEAKAVQDYSPHAGAGELLVIAEVAYVLCMGRKGKLARDDACAQQPGWTGQPTYADNGGS
jgi:hypothetical protein